MKKNKLTLGIIYTSTLALGAVIIAPVLTSCTSPSEYLTSFISRSEYKGSGEFYDLQQGDVDNYLQTNKCEGFILGLPDNFEGTPYTDVTTRDALLKSMSYQFLLNATMRTLGVQLLAFEYFKWEFHETEGLRIEAMMDNPDMTMIHNYWFHLADSTLTWTHVEKQEMHDHNKNDGVKTSKGVCGLDTSSSWGQWGYHTLGNRLITLTNSEGNTDLNLKPSTYDWTTVTDKIDTKLNSPVSYDQIVNNKFLILYFVVDNFLGDLPKNYLEMSNQDWLDSICEINTSFPQDLLPTDIVITNIHSGSSIGLTVLASSNEYWGNVCFRYTNFAG